MSVNYIPWYFILIVKRYVIGLEINIKRVKRILLHEKLNVINVSYFGVMQLYNQVYIHFGVYVL